MGNYELSEELFTPGVTYSSRKGLVTKALIPVGRTKSRITRSKHGYHRNWKVRNDLLRVELVYQTWATAMRAAELIPFGKVPVCGLIGAQHF